MRAGLLTVGAAFQQRSLKQRIRSLETVKKMYGVKHELAFQYKMTEESILLLREQRRLEETNLQAKFRLVGRSLMETIGCLEALGKSEDALQLAEKFKVSEKRFYHTKIRALVEKERWTWLRDFAKDRKPPANVGFAPFAQGTIWFNSIQ
jgi:hypothetical protein